MSIKRLRFFEVVDERAIAFVTTQSAIAFPFSYTINCVSLSHYSQCDRNFLLELARLQ
ncbi:MULTISPECIES: hypothetical protein [unclassified Nostoc]|uniref:hypothetical protein n=1 Tax=unclassified Nostoc TaxID=2593658 RepID=UPI00167B5F26|nr:hypothetical protein [Nostoc sp. 'Peltigera membranacea cyanobiont' 232]